MSTNGIPSVQGPPPPPREPAVLDELMDRAAKQMLAREEDTALSMFDLAARENPDVRAEAQDIARNLGVDPDLAVRNIDVLRTLRTRQAARQLLSFGYAPTLTRALQDPEFARVAHDDLHSLAWYERVTRGWEEGLLEMEQAKFGNTLRQRELTEDEKTRFAWLNERLRKPTGGFFGGTAKIARQQMEMLPGVIGGATAGAGLGFAAGLGPQDIITVPGMAVLGASSAWLVQSHNLEQGLAYLQMLDAHYDASTARWASAAVGAANSALDSVGAALLAKGAGVALNPLRRMLAPRVAQGVAAALEQPGFSPVALRFAKGWATGTGGEVATEVMQELVNVTAEEITRQLSANPDALSSSVTRGEVLQRLVDTAVQMTESMLLLGALGPFMDARGRLAQSQQRHRSFARMVATAAEMKLAERSPEMTEQFTGAVAREHGPTAVYVDGLRFAQVAQALETAQGPRVLDTLRRDMPDVARQVDAAVAAGAGDVEVPTGQWMSRLARTDLGEALREDLRVGDPDEPSLRELDEVKQLVPDMIEAATKSAVERATALRETTRSAIRVEKNIRAQFAEAAKDSPKITPEHVRAGAKLVRSFATVMGAKAGLSPEQFLAAHPYLIRGTLTGDETEAGSLQQPHGRYIPPGSISSARRYGSPKEGVAPVVGVHFSRQRRDTLSGSAYGTGLRGGEAERVAGDPRLTKRVHFYVDTGKGLVPEIGVGEHAHAVTLEGLYNTDEDPLGLTRKALDERDAGDADWASNLERAALDAGYSGIYVPRAQGDQGVAVLLGDQHEEVPVEYVGALSDLTADQFLHQLSPLTSALGRALAQLPEGKTLAVQGWREWLKSLTNKGVTKQEEIEWSGIPDLLDSPDMQRLMLGRTDGKLSREDIQKFTRHNGAWVEVLGAGAKNEPLPGEVVPQPRRETRWFVFDEDGYRVRRSTGYHTEEEANEARDEHIQQRVDETAEYVPEEWRVLDEDGDVVSTHDTENQAREALIEHISDRDIEVDPRDVPVTKVEGQELWVVGRAYPRPTAHGTVHTNENTARATAGDDGLIAYTEDEHGRRLWTIYHPGEVDLSHRRYFDDKDEALDDASTGEAVRRINDGIIVDNDGDETFFGPEQAEEAQDAFDMAYSEAVSELLGEARDELFRQYSIEHQEEEQHDSPLDQDELRAGYAVEQQTVTTEPPTPIQEAEDETNLYSKYRVSGGTNYSEVRLYLRGSPGDPYTAPHFGRSGRNLLAHYRSTVRRDTAGNKVLFVEEMQSDFGQEKHQKEERETRRAGYAAKRGQPYTPQEVMQSRAEAQAIKQANVAIEEIDRLMTAKQQEIDTASTALARGLEAGDANPTNYPHFQALVAQLEELRTRQDAAYAARATFPSVAGKLPPAPFTGKSEAWLTMLLKHIVHRAVEQGFDRVAIASGDQNVSHYRSMIVTAVKEIHVYPRAGGLNVGIQTPDGKAVSLRFNPEGALTEAPPQFNRFIEQEADVIGVFGKTLGEKILAATEETAITGDNLEIGGEGLRSFYDTLVPRVLSKLLPKIGGEGLVEVRVQEPGEADPMVQVGFDITDGLRKAVEAGIPLYQGGRRYARGEFSPRQLMTLLSQQADFSTFVHETGHYFLETMLRAAAEPTAATEVQNDASTILDWFGVKDLAEWRGMTLEQQRRHHEAWAYNFEVYIAEGRAPSEKMKSLFDRFAAWLRNVYASIRDELNAVFRREHGTDLPILTGEVREVMDRMLAAEAEVDRVLAARELAPLYLDRAQFTGSDEDWKRIQEIRERARDEAVAEATRLSLRELALRAGARSRAVKRFAKAYREERIELRAQAADEVRASPLDRARRWLRRGEVTEPDGSTRQGDRDAMHWLSRQGVQALALGGLDTGRIDAFLRDDGLPPDVAASLFGFPDGAALVRALIEAPDRPEQIEARTEELLREAHPELIPGTPAHELALERAVQGDARARVAALELTGLEGTGRDARTAQAAAREAARGILAKARARELLAPGRGERGLVARAGAAERRAAKKAQTALAAGDLMEALEAKRAQLVQAQLAKEAAAARTEIEDRLRGLRRFWRSDAATAETRDVDFVGAARTILASYGFGPVDQDSADHLTKVRDYNPELWEDVLAPIVDRTTRQAQDWRTLTINQLRELLDATDGLWEEARSMKQARDGERKIDLSIATDALRARLLELQPKGPLPGEQGAPSQWSTFGRWINGKKALLRRVEHWARAMDGGQVGPFTRHVWRPIRLALDRYRTQRNQYLDKFVALLKAYGPISNEAIEAPEIGYTFTRASLLGALLHTGNESNLEKLLVGRGWGEMIGDEDAQTLDRSRWDAFVERAVKDGILTRRDFDFAQASWDLMAELKPQVQRAHHEVYGFYMREVEAAAFTVVLPDGTRVNYKGGYAPARPDPFLNRDAQRFQKLEELRRDFRQEIAAAPSGFTKTRVAGYRRPLAIDVHLVSKHLSDTILFAHVQPAVKDVARVLRAPGLADLLGRVDPNALEGMLGPWLQRAANQSTSVPGWLDGFWRWVRQNVGAATMIANVSIALQNLTGLIVARTHIRGGYLRSAMWRYLHGGLTDDAAAKSAFLRDRLENQVFDLADQLDSLTKGRGVLGEAREWTRRKAYFLQRATQNLVDVIVWSAAHDQAITEGLSPEEAVTEADAKVRLTQSSLEPEDVAAYQASSQWVKVVTQFSGYFNTLANLQADSYARMLTETGLRRDKARIASTLLLGFLVPMLVSDAISRGFSGSWDDEDDDGYTDEFSEWLFGGTVRGASAMIPAVGPATGQLAASLFSQRGADDRLSNSPAVRALEAATAGVFGQGGIVEHLSAREAITGRNVRDLATLLTIALGTPLPAALGRPASYAADVGRGEVQPYNPADAARGLLTGRAAPGTRR